jgi:hypothetical protein
MIKPQYAHNCDSCEFLGQYAGHDLYYCGKADSGSVIARYSSEGSEYISYPVFIIRQAAEGLRYFRDEPHFWDEHPLMVAYRKLVDAGRFPPPLTNVTEEALKEAYVYKMGQCTVDDLTLVRGSWGWCLECKEEDAEHYMPHFLSEIKDERIARIDIFRKLEETEERPVLYKRAHEEFEQMFEDEE